MLTPAHLILMINECSSLRSHHYNHGPTETCEFVYNFYEKWASMSVQKLTRFKKQRKE